MGKDYSEEKDYSIIQKFLAYLVHIFTASGAFWGFLSLICYFQERYKEGTLFMIIAVGVDAIDGFFARKAHVKEVLPNFDGALMDNIIDFQTYTVIPLVMLWRSGLLEGVYLYLSIALVLFASLYQFSQEESKTEDYFFQGFPSYWNIVIIYLFWLSASPTVNLYVLIFFVILSFVPFKFIYPSRTKYFPISSLIVSYSGGLIFLYITLFSWNHPPFWTLVMIPTLFIIYSFMSFIASLRSQRC